MEAVRRESLIAALKSKENPEGRKATRLVYRAKAGGFCRMDVVPLDFRDESPTGKSWIHLMRPEGYAVAERTGPDKPPVIVTWSDNAREGHDDFSGYVFQWAPFRVYVFPVEWFVFAEPHWLTDYNIQSVSALEDGGERLVKITARAKAKRGGGAFGGVLVFYRDRAWAVKEVAFGSADPRTAEDCVQHGRCHYEGIHDGVPLLKRVECWLECGPDRTRYLVQEFDVVSVQPGPVPEEEFSPAVLGVEVAGQRSHWVPLMLGMLGTVLLLVLYLLLRRKEAKDTEAAA